MTAVNLQPRTLVAVLLNPAEGEGAPTHRHLATVAVELGCTRVAITNLFPTPTRNAAALCGVAHQEKDWVEHRPQISSALTTPESEILLGWGVSTLTGPAGRHLRAQVLWTLAEIKSVGRTAWVIGDGPRHPSRWHQYVSDRHGRTAAGTFAERLAQVLRPAPMVPAGRPSLADVPKKPDKTSAVTPVHSTV
jgi:hypothetical protein